MKQLREFETHIEHVMFTHNRREFTVAYVTICNEQEEVHYEPWYQMHNYEVDYLTFNALESGTFKLIGNAVQYSLDSGDTWVTLASNTNTPTVSEGGKILFKGELLPTSSNGIGTFSSSGRFSAEGNPMSLLHGDDFINWNAADYSFKYLFSGCTNLVTAENVVLTSDVLGVGCYEGMFKGCTSLEFPTEIYATTLANRCCKSMFEGCISMAFPPLLMNNVLAEECYAYMFADCQMLTNGTSLPATAMVTSCYEGMFKGCTRLRTAPLLQAKTLATNCYKSMFEGCTSLMNAPALKAKVMANGCYESMFASCTSLSEAPALPSTSLTTSCYANMFKGCTSLVSAPILKAASLESGCYNGMFSGCTSLNYIRALFITSPSASYTDNWVSNVAASGTFVKNELASWEVVGEDGVPLNWEVVMDIHDFSTDYLQFTALEDGTFSFDGGVLSYSLDNGDTWVNLARNASTTTVESGQTILMKAILSPRSSNGIGSFSSSGRFTVQGNPQSMVRGDDFINASLTPYIFKGLFKGCSKLVDCEYLSIDYTDLTNSCYAEMFEGCSSLTKFPALIGETLAPSCYYHMFDGCSSMTTAPQLIASTLENSCYEGMFKGCASLSEAPSLIAETLAPRCYYAMFQGCSSLINPPELDAIELASECYSYMFNGCSMLDYIKALFVTTPSTAYTDSWTEGVALDGTFVMSEDASWDVRGIHGIPVGWSAETEHQDFALKYITMTAIESTTFKFIGNSVSYSLDDGHTWNSLPSNTSTPIVPNGRKVMFKGSITPASNNGVGTFSSSGKFSVAGNPMSLIYGDDFISGSIVSYAFTKLFSGCTQLVSSERLALTASTLTTECYKDMFNGCTLLTKVPLLSATTLAQGCYQGMFEGCTSLTSADTISVTTLADSCYKQMYKNCTSLTSAPMLQAHTLASYCYQGMFEGCSSLVTAPQLSAETLAQGCYKEMFKNCSSLSSAPSLPSSSLAEYCYDSMFYGCTSLNASPSLCANTLVNGCYVNMFYGCTNLSTINVLCYNTPTTAYTNNWVYGVATSGTFVCREDASWAVTNYDGIPSGWTVDLIIPNYSAIYLTFKALETGTFKLSGNTSYYSLDSGTTWNQLNSNVNTPTIQGGNIIMFKGNITSPTEGNGIGRFHSTCKFDAKGNPMSMIYGDDFVGKPMKEYAFVNMFSGNTNLVNAEYMSLPTMTLATRCYSQMFSACTSLVSIPQLPADTLAISAYCYMFRDCTALTSSTTLSAMALTNACYYGMFERCSSLTGITELPATALTTDCYRAMYAQTAISTAPVLPALTLVSSCYRYLFNGCSNLTYIKAMFLTTPSTSYTTNFTTGVAANGTFVKNVNATWTTTGPTGVPNGWSIEYAES